MKKPPQPLRVLITAGPTREYIDSVRYLSNDSSGRMGFELAAEAARRGHAVVLVHGPVALPAPRGVRAVAVVSAAEMLKACRAAWRSCDVLLMAAAVADYTPAAPSRFKLKKSATTLTLRLAPTADILADLAARRRRGQVLIGFALEDRRAREHARLKLERKGLDAIALNAPSAIAAARSRLQVLVRDGGWEDWGEAGKAANAARLVRLAERLASAGPADRRQDHAVIGPAPRKHAAGRRRQLAR